MKTINKAQKLILSIMLIITLTGMFLNLPANFAAAEDNLRQQVESAIDSAAMVALNNHYSMDWVSVGLARSGKQDMIPDDYLDSVAAVLGNPSNHTQTFKIKPTEFERMTLGVLAAGGDPTNIGGYNMIKQIYNADLASQGINAVIFGLIAVDAGNYDVPSDARWTREKMIEFILGHECSTGGWALSGDTGDPDITGMAMTALATYYNMREDVKSAVDRAVDYLSSIQRSDGGYDSWGSTNSESCAQVIMGLCANGMDPTGPKFTKDGGNLVQAILRFKASDGGFKHIMSEATSNGMATEQVLYALAQYLYFLDGKGSIYRWGDKEHLGAVGIAVSVEGKNGLILPKTVVQVPGGGSSATIKDAVKIALEQKNIPYAENAQGFDSIGGEMADSSSNEKWLCSVEDGLPIGDMTSRKIHNYENITVYLGRHAGDFIYAWLEIPRSSAGINTSVFKPHEIEVCEGQEVELTLNGYVFDSEKSEYEIKAVSGAAIYVDGQQYYVGGKAVSTDTNGKATVRITELGSHTVVAKKENMRSARFDINILPDTAPPTVSFSSHLRNISAGQSDTIDFFWVYPKDNKDAGKDISVTVKLNGTALTPSQIREDNGARKFSNVTFNKYCNELEVTLSDTLGNTATVKKRVINFNYPDDTAPIIEVDGITGGMIVTNAMLEFTVEISDEAGEDLIPIVKLNGNMLTAADDGISYSCVLIQGENTITIEADDAAGNRAGQTFTVVYNKPFEPDTTAPVINTDLENKKVDNRILTFTASAEDDLDGPVTVTAIVYGQEIKPDSFGVYMAILEEGENEVRLTAQDNSGNRAIKSFTVTYEPPDEDNLPPDIITTAKDEAVTSGFYSFTAFAVDNVDGYVAVSVAVYGGEASFDSGVYKINLIPGENTIIIKAADNAGNDSEKTYTVKYVLQQDTNPPVITTSAEDKTVSQRDYTFTASAIDDVDGPLPVTVKFNGEIISATDGTYTVSLQDGDNTVEIIARDSSGNEISQVYTIIYQTQETPVQPEGVSVSIRIEGYDRTFVKKTRLSGVTNFDLTPYLGPASGSSATPSKGWGPDRLKKPTVAHATIMALEDKGYDCTDHKKDFDLQDYGWSLYVAMIGGDREFDHRSTSGWLYRVNGWLPNYGCQAYELKGGEYIEWYFAAYGFETWYTQMKADKADVKTGEEVTLTLTGEKTDLSGKTGVGPTVKKNIEDAVIYVDGHEYKMNGKTVKTDKDGKAVISFNNPGTYEVSAERFSGERLRDILRPEPIKIKVTGEAIVTPQSAAGEFFAAGATEEEILGKINKTMESLKQSSKSIKSAQESLDFADEVLAASRMYDEGMRRVESQEATAKIAQTCSDTAKLLSETYGQLIGNDSRAKAKNAAINICRAVIRAFDRIKDEEEIDKLAREIIESIGGICQKLGDEDSSDINQAGTDIAEAVVARIGSIKLPQSGVSMVDEKATAHVKLDEISAVAEKAAKKAEDMEKFLTQSGIELRKAIERKLSVELPETGKKEVETVMQAGIFALLHEQGINHIEIKTEWASINVPEEAFAQDDWQKDISLITKSLDAAKISGGAEATEANYLVEFEAKAGEDIVKTLKKPVVVGIYHKANSEDKDAVTAFLLKDDGSVSPMGGIYNEESKTIKFLTTLPGRYFAGENAGKFYDMEKAQWAENAVRALAAKGIVKGKDENIFDPGTAINRAEFASLIVRMLKLESEESVEMKFKDVGKNKWYYSTVGTAYKNGLISGKSEDIFDPEGGITRQEMAVIISKVLESKGYKRGDIKRLDTFSDGSEMADWAKEAIALVAREGIITGDGNGRFLPKEKATRAQVAVVLYRLYNLIMK
ncbi:MAG: S-layer homology domain-containing protein [Eubacteriales bacterium]|nr:S-layer homology domain-containing protein [Eubacteriales bacterium]